MTSSLVSSYSLAGDVVVFANHRHRAAPLQAWLQLSFA